MGKKKISVTRKIKRIDDDAETDGRKISAGEAVRLLFHNEIDTYWQHTTWKPERNIPGGKKIHQDKGYDQPEVFWKYYFCKPRGSVYKIFGQPDKLDIPNNLVIELKTYRYPCNRDRQLLAGWWQAEFYDGITGLEYYQVHLYNAVTKEMEVMEERKFNLRHFRRNLNAAIELKIAKQLETNQTLLAAEPARQVA